MVLFFDSGVGGIAYLDEFRRRNPSVPSMYLADTAGFPYGDKDPGVVRDRVVRIVGTACRRWPVDAVVLACNTASVVALAELREMVAVPVVGTVPAVKPAAATTRSGHIAVLATHQTVHDPYTDGLLEQFARLARVSRIGLPRLVAAAEQYFCDGDPAPVRAVIDADVRARLAPDVDTVVLACTHFVRFRDLFEEILGPGVRVVDSLDGVTRRIAAVRRSAEDSTDRNTTDHDPAADAAPAYYHTGGAGVPVCRSARHWQAVPELAAQRGVSGARGA